MWKKHLEISWFFTVYQKILSNDVQFLKYGVQETDKQTATQMEKVTYRGGCPT